MGGVCLLIIFKFKGNVNGSGELLNDWKLDSDDGW